MRRTMWLDDRVGSDIGVRNGGALDKVHELVEQLNRRELVVEPRWAHTKAVCKVGDAPVVVGYRP